MNHPEVVLIVARADNGVIGVDGKLPWHLPADLRRFKQLTLGAPMIMGRKTFDSLPGLLPDRRHIVLTRNADWAEDGAETATSVDDAMRLARQLDVGGVHINETSSSRVDMMPYGGTKDSGFGREGPHHAVREMSEERMITLLA